MDQKPEVMEDATLMVTRRTLRVGEDMYLTGSMCHVGPSHIPLFKIPNTVAIIVIGIGLLLVLQGMPAVLLLFLAVGMAWWNISGPRRYGLLVSFSSGESRFFPTGDKGGLAKAVEHVHRLLESIERDGSTEIRIDSAEVTIRDNVVGGSINAGYVGGDLGSSSGYVQGPGGDKPSTSDSGFGSGRSEQGS